MRGIHFYAGGRRGGDEIREDGVREDKERKRCLRGRQMSGPMCVCLDGWLAG